MVLTVGGLTAGMLTAQEKNSTRLPALRRAGAAGSAAMWWWWAAPGKRSRRGAAAEVLWPRQRQRLAAAGARCVHPSGGVRRRGAPVPMLDRRRLARPRDLRVQGFGPRHCESLEVRCAGPCRLGWAWLTVSFSSFP